MRRCRALFVALAVLAPVVVDAQTRPRPRPQPRTPVRTQPPAGESAIGFRGYVTFGSTALAAHESFDAVADTHSRENVGGGGQVTNIWKGVFADVAVSQWSLDGQRAFVLNRQVFRLGIPLEAKMRPVDLAAGWRLRLLRGRLSPYGGAGLTYLTYAETSQFAGSGEDVRESKTGPLLLAGVDVRIWRWIHAGGELRWRRVNGILGESGLSGVSTEFDEDDAGGVSGALRISVAIR